MKFQIKKLIIWPTNIVFSPRIIEFELSKVNIITGDSRTGKTAIVPIIDYCLGSQECSIPIKVIRDYASWYGLIIVSNDEEILIARKAPSNGKASGDFYYQMGKQIEVPWLIEKPNQTLEGIKITFNNLAQIPYINKGQEDNGFDNTISFRDTCHLCFQSQDIIANQSILFYKTHLNKHREKLRNWFPFILGAETKESILAKEELKRLEKELNQKQKEYATETELSGRWLNKLIGTLQKSKFYNLYNESINPELSQEELLVIAKDIISKSGNEIFFKSNNNDVILELENCENELDILANEAAVISKRIRNIEKIEKTLKLYDDGTRRKINRLGISNWFIKNSQDANECPFCGSKEHVYAKEEILKISNAVKKYEESSTKSSELPAALNRELQSLKQEEDSINQNIQNLLERKKALAVKSEEFSSYTEKRNEMLKYIGQLDFTVQTIENLTDAGGLSSEIDEIKRSIKIQQGIINKYSSEKRLTYFLNQIAEFMLTCLKELDVDPDYKLVSPEFSIEEMSIKVKDKEGNQHIMTEIGSASNWVSFHVSLSCAIQEFLNTGEKKSTCVPSFVVYDQPSQVYFPQTVKNKEEKLDDNDINAVKQIFTTIANSIQRTKGAWQAIILEHADSGTYADIPNVHEVEVWRNGKKLIPEEWMKGNN